MVATVMGNAGTEESIFHSIWTVFILSAFVAVQILCIVMLKPKFSLYRLGFYFLHLGLVLFLIGGFIYYIMGDKINVSVTVDSTRTYNQIQREKPAADGSTFVKLGFDMGISDFKVEKYKDDNGNDLSDKYYEAALVVIPDGTRDITTAKLTVNHPYPCGRWKIYLMGYDGTTGSTVNLMLKKDPGEILSNVGIWMVIMGAVFMCLLKVKPKKDGDTDD